MGTCGQPGYVFRDFCLKQGIKFIIFCLNQGIDLSIFLFYPIHTEIFAPKINEINFIPVRDCWLLIGRTVFVTSEKYRPTNHRPRTALCH